MRKATIGKILGALGLVLLITTPITFLFTTAVAGLAIGKAAVGVVLLIAYLVTNLGELAQFGSRKSTFFVVSSVVFVAVAVAALGAVNYIVAKRAKPIDLTAKKLFSLAPQSVQVLHNLKDKVTAITFIDPRHPYHDQIDALLARYHHEAPDKFEYAFYDPKKNPEIAKRYQLKEGQATIVLTRGEKQNESHTTVDVAEEQELTNALIKLNSVGEQKVYFVAGHGEWPMTASPAEKDALAVSELVQKLRQEGYAPDTLNIAGKQEVPRDASLVIIAGARTKFSPSEISALQKYLAQGGRLALFVEPLVETGLEKLAQEYGVQLDPGIIADDRFAYESPYVILSPFFGDHEISRPLKDTQLNIQLVTARGLTILHDGLPAGTQVTPVALTSPFAWEETTPNDHPERSDGEKTGQIPVVAAATRAVTDAKDKRYDETRVVVFGDAELLVDAYWGHEGNRNLVLNAIGWASNQINQITIRPPDRDNSVVDITPAMLSKIRFVAVDLFPLSLLGVGLAIWLARRDR